MKINYSVFNKTLIILCFIFSGKGIFSQTVNVPYQFYLDANNNCTYDGGENLLYNLRGAITFTYVNASSATVNVLDSVNGCAPFVAISNPQTPPVNGFSVSPTWTTSFSTFTVNSSCLAYSNLSYTTTNYLPIQNAGAISQMYSYSSITGFYMASSTVSVFPVCSNVLNDSLNFYFTVDNIYACAGFNASRTYSVLLDATLLDVVVVNSGTGLNSVSSTSCVVREYYYNPTSNIIIKAKLSNAGLTLGNHLFELRTTPLYTSTLSTLNYSCMIMSSPCGVISGNIYADCDNNCALSLGDIGASNLAYLKVYDAANSFNINAASNGSFTAMVPASITQYSITSMPFSLSYTPCATASQTYAIPNTTTTPYNFGYKGSGSTDPTVYPHGMALMPVAGGIFKPYVWLNNQGNSSCATSSVNPGKVKILMDKNFTYQMPVSPTTAPDFIVPGPSGDTLIWNVPDFNIFTGGISYCVQVAISNTISTGTTFSIKGFINPQFDTNTGNNQATDYGTIGSPFDPNGKRCYSNGIAANGDIPFGNQDFYYFVGFQNVGSASATNVRTIDTLDSNLDWTTLNVIGSSFPVQTQVDQISGQTIFYFQNINLPDSTTNEPGSHGYVYYHIKLKPSVPVSTIIKNRAHNYFDFQPPVATNQTKNKLVNVTGINEIEKINSVFIAPNPVTEKVTISSKEIIQSVSVFNNLGQVVIKQEVNGLQSQMDLSSLPNSIYFVTLQFKEGGNITRKVIKTN